MKFLYFADGHGKGRNPVSRLDNYYKSWLLKIEELLSIANEKSCDKIICGGDLFDSPSVSNTIIDDFVDRVEESKIPFLVVPGNHDEIGHNWELSKSSALAHMFRRSKVIEKLHLISGDSFHIEGFEYSHDIENELKENGLFCSGKMRKDIKGFTIAVPHAFISIKPFFKEVAHICAKDLKCDFDLVLCSHFHMTFDETINGTRFINPNSLGRTSIREQHTPTVLIVDTESKEIEKIELKSAKPASEIFDLAKYEENKQNEKGIDEFIASLNSYQWQEMSIGKQIKEIGKDQKVEDRVIDYLINKVEGVKNV